MAEHIIGIDPANELFETTVFSVYNQLQDSPGVIVRYFVPTINKQELNEQIHKLSKYYGASLSREYPLTPTNNI